MTSTRWDVEADTLLALPVDDLALRILKDARDTNEKNWHTWIAKAKPRYADRRDVHIPLAEAWAWLSNRGLIVWDPDQSGAGFFVISRQGDEALQRGLPWVRAVQRLDLQLVVELEAKARPQFLRGDFEAASFMAMKEIEVRVRTMTGLSDSLVGTKLMQKAFQPPPKDNPERVSEAGGLWRSDVDPGESVALMELFKGAIGLFKNPTSHRRVDYNDPTEAVEVVLLADLLMRLLNKLGMNQ